MKQTVFNRATEDVGNIAEFGHVNVRVPSQQCAIIFYIMGLGLTRDPYLRTGIDNAWINVGTSQFHLPVGPAQVLRGVIGLVMPDLDALMARLTSIQPLLQDTWFRFSRSGMLVEVTCPWGNRIRVHAPDARAFWEHASGHALCRDQHRSRRRAGHCALLPQDAGCAGELRR